jgi:hypothetical protein
LSNLVNKVMNSKERMKMSSRSNTTFTSRGRLTGLLRDEAPAGTGQNLASRSSARDEAARGSNDEALYYRARLILGESLPRPRR